jgi:hypothetical protein
MLSASSRVFIHGAHFENSSSLPKYDWRIVGTPRGDSTRLGIEVDGLAEQRCDVAVSGQLLTQGPTDLACAEGARCALIEEGLEDVACRAVQQGDVDVGLT